MGDYLYLIPFNDGKFFKIGISSGDYKRVEHHNNQFGVNLNKTVIIKGSKRIIRALEAELLFIFPECVHDYKGDGYTEIREVKYFEEAIDIIKTKDSRLCLTFEKFKVVPKIIPILKKDSKASDTKYSDLIYEIIDNIYHCELITQYFSQDNILDHIWIETERVNLIDLQHKYPELCIKTWQRKDDKGGLFMQFNREDHNWEIFNLFKYLLKKKTKTYTHLYGDQNESEILSRIRNFINNR